MQQMGLKALAHAVLGRNTACNERATITGQALQETGVASATVATLAAQRAPKAAQIVGWPVPIPAADYALDLT